MGVDTLTAYAQASRVYAEVPTVCTRAGGCTSETEKTKKKHLRTYWPIGYLQKRGCGRECE